MSIQSPHYAYYRTEQAFLEQKVETAKPIQLVCMLYEGALQAIQDARNFLASGEILARGRAISRAQAILVELTESLKEQYEPDVAGRLRVLYDYALTKLQDGHIRQDGQALAEAEAILKPLNEAWQLLAMQESSGEMGEQGGHGAEGINRLTVDHQG